MHKKLFLVFPGQGSQHSFMLSKNELLSYAKSSKNKIALDCLSDLISEDALSLIESDDDRINQTSITQPILLFVSYLHYQKLLEVHPNIEIDSMSGHSLGEYTALVCASAIDICDALKLVRSRGELMEKAENGSMSAILGMDTQDVINICKNITSESAGVVNAANLNSPLQTVISGNTAEIELAEERCKDHGAKRAIRLNVSVASHSELMREPANLFCSILEEFDICSPQFKIYQNADAIANTDHNLIKDNLVKQLYMPVKWLSIMQHVTNDHYLIEVGPSKVLAGLCKANGVKEFSYTSISNYSELFLES